MAVWLGASLLLAWASAPTRAASERLWTAYEVTWNGLEIAVVETELTLGPKDYKLAYDARTTGLIGWLFPFSSEGASQGVRSEVGVQPSRFSGQSHWDDNQSSWSVAFDDDGRATDIEVSSPYLDDREPVPAALQVAPDPLALALEATAAATAGLRRQGASFDGRRAVHFDFACDRREVYMAGTEDHAGADLVCLLDGRLVAGASRRWRDRMPADDEREPTRIWFARGILEGGYWPVHIEAETPYGTVEVRLNDLAR